MSQYGEWSADAEDPALNTSGVESRYASQLGDTVPTTQFVIDTSRNGLGPWQYPADTYPVHEDWCNPPDRGLGSCRRPRRATPSSTRTSGSRSRASRTASATAAPEDRSTPLAGWRTPLPANGSSNRLANSWRTRTRRSRRSTVTSRSRSPGLARASSLGLVVHNQGVDSVHPWTLSWTFEGDQQVASVSGGEYTQLGADVAVTAAKQQAKLTPGKKATITVKGTGGAVVPWLFLLNGKACTSG